MLNKDIMINGNEIDYKIEDFEYILPYLPVHTKRVILLFKCKVNLYYVTCSCKTYRENIKFYPRRDYRRLCSHIVNNLLKEENFQLDSFTKLLLENYLWTGKEHLKKLKFNSDLYSDEIILGTNDNKLSIYLKEHNWVRYSLQYNGSYWLNNKYPKNIFIKTFFEKYCNIIKYKISENIGNTILNKISRKKHVLSKITAKLLIVSLMSNYFMDNITEWISMFS
jgi:hypothetical protein